MQGRPRTEAEPLSLAERARRHRERKAEREKNAAVLMVELLKVAPAAEVARLEADERFSDIIESARKRAE